MRWKRRSTKMASASCSVFNRSHRTFVRCIAAMKLSSNLERISDQAVKIAERAHSLTRKPVLEEAATLGPMFIEATTLFRDSVRAYADADVALARSLRERDREIDEMNRHIANDLTASMTQSAGPNFRLSPSALYRAVFGARWRSRQKHWRRRRLRGGSGRHSTHQERILSLQVGDNGRILDKSSTKVRREPNSE